MRNIIASIILLCCSVPGSAQLSPAEQLASRIAQKMKDTLALSEIQRQSIYNVNVMINNQKTVVRQQHKHIDSIGMHLQAVESRRDTLYYPLLTPQQYQLYKGKKRSLVSNN